MTVTLRAERLDTPVVTVLLDELLAEYGRRYGAAVMSRDPSEFAPPQGLLLVASCEGQPVGCGGYRPFGPGTVELKRMYVRPAARRRGIASRLLVALEQSAIASGASTMRLETGVRQPEAVRLYETSGYLRIAAIRPSSAVPNSLCFEKRLA